MKLQGYNLYKGSQGGQVNGVDCVSRSSFAMIVC